MSRNESLTIQALRNAISPEFYSRNKKLLDKLAFEIGIEQQEFVFPKKQMRAS